jgi:hypothetical protein
MKTRELIEALQKLVAEHPETAELRAVIGTDEYSLDVANVTLEADSAWMHTPHVLIRTNE